VSRDYVVTHQGTAYVDYRGLLVEAHRLGVSGIRVRALQLPSPANGQRAVCEARVTAPAGEFTALGEAWPGSAARGDATTLLLLAQLRARARALCEALNLRLVPIEDSAAYLPEGSSPGAPAPRAGG
jgi:hypothetical protein